MDTVTQISKLQVFASAMFSAGSFCAVLAAVFFFKFGFYKPARKKKQVLCAEPVKPKKHMETSRQEPASETGVLRGTDVLGGPVKRKPAPARVPEKDGSSSDAPPITVRNKIILAEGGGD